MFRELAIQFAGQHLYIPPNISLTRCCWNAASAVIHYSGRSAEPQKQQQASGICKFFLQNRYLTLSLPHSKYLNRKRRFSRRFMTASTGINRPIPELFRPFSLFRDIGRAGLLFRCYLIRLFRQVLQKAEISSALLDVRNPHPRIQRTLVTVNYTMATALQAECLHISAQQYSNPAFPQ